MTRLEIATRLMECAMPTIMEQYALDKMSGAQMDRLTDALKEEVVDGKPRPFFHSALCWRLAGDLTHLAVGEDQRTGTPT